MIEAGRKCHSTQSIPNLEKMEKERIEAGDYMNVFNIEFKKIGDEFNNLQKFIFGGFYDEREEEGGQEQERLQQKEKEHSILEKIEKLIDFKEIFMDFILNNVPGRTFLNYSIL